MRVMPEFRHQFRHLKTAVFALLAANLVLFHLFGTATQTLDTAAWLALLVLFELETAGRVLLDGWRQPALRAARLIAGAAVLAAAVGYVLEEAWLDALNAWLWLAVVVLLEGEVRYPQLVLHRRKDFMAATGVVYGALLILVAVWAWQGDWLDAWDALLWLVAFFAIEMTVLDSADRERNGYPVHP